MHARRPAWGRACDTLRTIEGEVDPVRNKVLSFRRDCDIVAAPLTRKN
jgi:hypothetical protein